MDEPADRAPTDQERSAWLAANGDRLAILELLEMTPRERIEDLRGLDELLARARLLPD